VIVVEGKTMVFKVYYLTFDKSAGNLRYCFLCEKKFEEKEHYQKVIKVDTKTRLYYFCDACWEKDKDFIEKLMRREIK
jgi:hypothetical protein